MLDASLQKLASSFNSGNIVLDNFLRSEEAINPYVGRTYIWLSDDQTHIIGYYSICTGCIMQDQDGCMLKIGGSVHINDFAVDEKYHGWKMEEDGEEYNLSDVLLMDCMTRINTLNEQIGFSFITLNSTDRGYSLYKRNGFDEIEDDMFLPSSKEEEKCRAMYFALEYEL